MNETDRQDNQDDLGAKKSGACLVLLLVLVLRRRMEEWLVVQSNSLPLARLSLSLSFFSLFTPSCARARHVNVTGGSAGGVERWVGGNSGSR